MKGVLLMAYGSPATMDDVEAYFTHIRGGRKPDPGQLEDLKARYQAIGGPSPLLAITEKQAAALRRSLRDSGSDTQVYAGMKHSPPFIEDVVKDAAAAGVTKLLCVALAPHYSRISIGGYQKAVEGAALGLAERVSTTFVKSWHDRPKFIAMWANSVESASSGIGSDASLVFTAHSLPQKILAEGDPYKAQLLESSGLVANRLGGRPWTFAFQSASKTGEPWLGPDIIDHLEELRKSGIRKFLIAPIGFVSDHLEILYDIDVECAEWANKRGLALERTKSANDGSELIDCLVDVVNSHRFS